MTHATRPSSPARPHLTGVAALTVALAVGACVDVDDEPQPADAADVVDPATDDVEDPVAVADDAHLPGFARAHAGPQIAEAPVERVDEPGWICPEGQACEAPIAPAARGFTLSEREAPRARAIPRERHDGRLRTPTAADLVDRYKNVIDVKLVEGSGIRARGGALVVDRGAVVGEAPDAELTALVRLLAGQRRHAAAPMHLVDEATLGAWKQEGERATGEPLPDLRLWLQIYVETDDDDAFADLIGALNRSPLVEIAQATPLPSPPTSMTLADAEAFTAAVRGRDRLAWPDAARLDPGLARSSAPAPAPTEPSPPAAWMRDDDELVDAETGARIGGAQDLGFTAADVDPSAAVPDYASLQTYRGAAPVGLDIDYLRGNYWNAWGDAWGVTDVEYNWNRSHADLGALAGAGVVVGGTPYFTTTDVVDHGTGVMGILSSGDNGFGTTGMVPKAAVRLAPEATTEGTTRAAAITTAASQFWKGAVILLEMQVAAGFDCNGDGAINQSDLVPAEWDSSVKDAVKTAVANGRIVVAAAGNGNCDLDHASFGGAFSATDPSRDSGAILVGAGVRDTRNKEDFSTFGARVDVQGQGSQIVTTGYGDLYKAEGYDRQYTQGFNGTSGASPMVTSAAVALASILWEYHGSIYDPRELRDLLRRDGTAQGTGGHIGRRPDLRKQIVHMHNRHVQVRSTDFDGDQRDDYAVFRPETGVWYIYFSGTGATTAIQWGAQGDIPVPANMTGDGRAELVVYRPSTGVWHVRRWDGSSYAVQWGQNGDVPAPMDHDGDGYASPAVFRQANMGGTQWSRWYVRNNESSYTWFDWGENGDVPLVADFDADGRDDFAVFRGTTGAWYIYQWSGQVLQRSWGAWGDVPLIHEVGGRPHIAVWRPSNGTFYQMNLTDGTTSSTQWGTAGDVPRLADTDGDGKSERVVYRPNAGVWYNLDKWWGIYWGAVGDMALLR